MLIKGLYRKYFFSGAHRSSRKGCNYRTKEIIDLESIANALNKLPRILRTNGTIQGDRLLEKDAYDPSS
jgi:hypothetical protein